MFILAELLAAGSAAGLAVLARRGASSEAPALAAATAVMVTDEDVSGDAAESRSD
jgi:hypothetical protein